MASDRELATYMALRYLSAHPAQRAAVTTIMDQIDAGTFIPSNSPGAVTAINEAIAFLNNAANVTIPVLVAQLTTLRARSTPV